MTEYPKPSLFALACLLVGIAIAPAANSATFGQVGDSRVFSGRLDHDNDVRLHYVNLTSPLTMRFETFHYAGGTTGGGNVVPAGGFDPIVSVFDGSGTLVGYNDDGDTGRFDPVTGASYDSRLRLSLSSGVYLAAVTQYDNFPAGFSLAEGFFQDADQSFTASFGCSAGMFCDVTGDNRDSGYVLEVAAVPVPAALPLLLGGLAAIGALSFRRSAPAA